jgi:hypothetical protein
MSMKVICITVALLVAGVSSQAFSKALSASAKAEIRTLLIALGSSGCDFYRNGTWHDSAKARAHIESKLAYLERKELVASAEEFIELGATRSSSSGEAYQVRCAGKAPEPSATWLRRQLMQVRGGAQ